MIRRISLKLLPALLSCLILTGACTTYSSGTYIGSDAYELAQVKRDDGSVERYVVDADARRGVAVQQTIERDEDMADFGMRVAELDKADAESRGVRPYTGLLVRGLAPGSAAGSAGIVAGDIITRIDDEEVVYGAQLRNIMRRLPGGMPVKVQVLRGQSEVDMSVTPQARKERSREVVTIPLESTTPTKPYAGVVLRAIPKEWVERIHGDTRNAILMAGVELGSPAWLAGFRGGDMVTAVDGEAVPPLHELTRQIAERGAVNGRVRLTVSHGDAAPYEAEIVLSDYQRTEEVHFPLVFRVSDGVVTNQFSVGPFGLVLSNKRSYIQNRSRVLETESTFNALLGLFHVRSTPNRSIVRLLWFIKISSG